MLAALTAFSYVLRNTKPHSYLNMRHNLQRISSKIFGTISVVLVENIERNGKYGLSSLWRLYKVPSGRRSLTLLRPPWPKITFLRCLVYTAFCSSTWSQVSLVITVILFRAQWNSVHDCASDHGLALSRRVLVSPPAYSIRPTCSDYFAGASNTNGCVATHKLSVHKARNHCRV